jgi:hypothetical protein
VTEYLHGYPVIWESIESRRWLTARVSPETVRQVPPPEGIELTRGGVRILAPTRTSPAHTILDDYLARCRQAENRVHNFLATEDYNLSLGAALYRDHAARTTPETRATAPNANGGSITASKEQPMLDHYLTKNNRPQRDSAREA